MTHPILIKAGDDRVKINGQPPLVDCRILAEQNYQAMMSIFKDLLRCSSFYPSAIELDCYECRDIDGEQIEKRIKEIVQNKDTERPQSKTGVKVTKPLTQ